MVEIVDLDTLNAAIADRRLSPSTEPIYVSPEAMVMIRADPRVIANPAFHLIGKSFRWKNVPVIVKPPIGRAKF